jgi:hypothetical protein
MLKLVAPSEAIFIDVGPEAVREGEPVRSLLTAKANSG